MRGSQRSVRWMILMEEASIQNNHDIESTGPFLLRTPVTP